MKKKKTNEPPPHQIPEFGGGDTRLPPRRQFTPRVLKGKSEPSPTPQEIEEAKKRVEEETKKRVG